MLMRAIHKMSLKMLQEIVALTFLTGLVEDMFTILQQEVDIRLLVRIYSLFKINSCVE